jgi:hypothetical protein
VSVLAEDVTFPTNTRVRVRVQRSGVSGNPLSTFIAPMFGVPTVDLGAEATAEVSPANAMTCVKPFTVSRQMDREADAAMGSQRHVRRVRQQGKAAGQSGRLCSIGPDRLHGYNAERTRARSSSLKAGTGDHIAPSFYFPYSIGDRSGAERIPNGTSATATRP